MAEKPTSAKEYSSDQAKLVRATCLYVATILGDYMEDIVIVGGLVPSLLIDQDSLPEGTDHITGGKDDGIQADVIGFVRQLIDLCS